jgi:hypothetical protein
MTERSRAGCRFFQRFTHRFGADRIDQAQDDHLVCEQLQGPVTSPAGWVSAGQLDQLLLHVSFDLDFVWARRLRPVIDGCLQSFDDKSFPDPSDGVQTRTQSGDDFIVGVAFPMHAIGQQQNAGMSQLTTGGPSSGNQVLQSRAFLRDQRDTILFHSSAPSLDAHPRTDASKKQELALPVNCRLTGSPDEFSVSDNERFSSVNEQNHPPIED